MKSGITVTVVVETVVVEVPAYHASCLSCGWRCHKRPHHDVDTAARCAERHQEQSHA